MRMPKVDVSVFKERRAELAKLAEGSAVIIPSHPELIRNHDVHHAFRQDSSLYYLTGFEEPESVFIFRPGKDPESVLFVRKKDVFMETWDGFRYGPEAAQEIFLMDAAFTMDQFHDEATQLLLDVDRVYCTLFQNSWFDSRFEELMMTVKARRGRSGRGLLPISDTYPLVGEMRVIKSEFEVAQMRKAAEISSSAHIALMKATRPGINERELHGLFIHEVMKGGCAREGYNAIVAGGDNACTLHYIFNDQTLKDGDLLLVDAGGEYNHYSADITRTWSVNGKFTEAQARLYDKVLSLQKRCVEAVKPGLTLKEFQNLAVEGLTDIMKEEKLLSGSRDEIIEKQLFKKYYPHGLGHFLGLDVHDAGAVEIDGRSRALEAGMTLTVEPGIYIPASDEQAPAELRGIGIRIEDDLVVTKTGNEVLTTAAPKERSDLEVLIGSA